jgi:hypothetical protein
MTRVTDTSSRREGTASRSERLEAELASAVEQAERRWRPDDPWNAFSGVRSAEEALARAALSFLRASSYRCERCERPFVEGDVVYRRTRRASLCRNCIAAEKMGEYWLAKATEPCVCEGGCGVLVSSWRNGRAAWRVCSDRCCRLARNARRRRSRVVRCETCGKEFEQRRSDHRFHSGACRQASYRERRKGKP